MTQQELIELWQFAAASRVGLLLRALDPLKAKAALDQARRLERDSDLEALICTAKVTLAGGNLLIHRREISGVQLLSSNEELEDSDSAPAEDLL